MTSPALLASTCPRGRPQNLPFYRLFVAEARARRDGRHLDVVGYYDPHPGEAGREVLPCPELAQQLTLPVVCPAAADGNKHIGLDIPKIK